MLIYIYIIGIFFISENFMRNISYLKPATNAVPISDTHN